MKYLNKIGNGAIHANDGNVDQQKTIDNELLSNVVEVFRMLLFVIYEVDAKKKRLLNSFRTASDELSR